MPSADESEDPTRPTGQSVAHSWQATDRFVPRVVVRPLQSLMSVETARVYDGLARTTVNPPHSVAR